MRALKSILPPVRLALLLLTGLAISLPASAAADDSPRNRAVVAQVTNTLLFGGDAPLLLRVEREGPSEKISRFATVGCCFLLQDRDGSIPFYSVGAGSRRYFRGDIRRGWAFDLEILTGFWGRPFFSAAPGLGIRRTFGGEAERGTGLILDTRISLYLMKGGSWLPVLPYANIGVGFGF